jgi:dipeptidyl aminopeptidase/acylaminoacyl peptidase
VRARPRAARTPDRAAATDDRVLTTRTPRPEGTALSKANTGATALSLATYFALPRVTGLAVAPDGERIVVQVTTATSDMRTLRSELRELRSNGRRQPHRLPLSDLTPTLPVFLPDGSLLCTRHGAEAAPGSATEILQIDASWCDVTPIARVPGTIHALAAASNAPIVVIRADLLPEASTFAEDVAASGCERELGPAGIVFDEYPIRYLDRELGPRKARLLRWDIAKHPSILAATNIAPTTGNELFDAQFAVSPDGGMVVTTWSRRAEGIRREVDLIVIADDGIRPLAQGGGDFSAASISPDGRWVAAFKQLRGSDTTPLAQTIWLVDLVTGEGWDLLPDFDLWPGPPAARELAWHPDGESLYFVADERGHAPVFRAWLDPGRPPTRLTDDGAYRALCPPRHGDGLFAVRSAIDSPPRPIWVPLDGRVKALHTVTPPLRLPGHLSSVCCQGADDHEVRGWLVLPENAAADTPAPLVLWIHGGPLESFNTWSWRWCPYLLAAHGYAVLLPDPALSTGYGQHFLARAWGDWGGQVFTDLMAITDAASELPEIDATRVAAMGASFGGYMANWIAGHTTRFNAIVTHAGFWALDQFMQTTDMAWWWEYHHGPVHLDERAYRLKSPRAFLGAIRTPMLVTHGARDYRVPISEALSLWCDLQRHGVPSRFLYFPDEGHWVDGPSNALLWYETVLTFLDEHLRQGDDD